MCTLSLRCSRHSLALREKLVGALNIDENHASKRVKRRLDHNDDLLTVCQDIIAHAALPTMTMTRTTKTIATTPTTMTTVTGLAAWLISPTASETESLEEAVSGGVSRRFWRLPILRKSSMLFIW